MEMNALYLDTNSMFNFDVLRARTHELDMIKEMKVVIKVVCLLA